MSSNKIKEYNSHYTKCVVIILIMSAEVSQFIEKKFSLWTFLLKIVVASYLTSKKDSMWS